MTTEQATAIADGCAYGASVLPDPFADNDALDMCIGKANRIRCRLIQLARHRAGLRNN